MGRSVTDGSTRATSPAGKGCTRGVGEKFGGWPCWVGKGGAGGRGAAGGGGSGGGGEGQAQGATPLPRVAAELGSNSCRPVGCDCLHLGGNDEVGQVGDVAADRLQRPADALRAGELHEQQRRRDEE